MMWPFILMIVVPMIAFPLGFNWMANRVERRIEESRGWSATDATMVHSKVHHHKGVWRPMFVYSYSAQGRELRSSRYCFGGFTGTAQEVKDLVARYPVGAKVPAYYDPARPKFAVLDRSGQARSYRLAGWAMSGFFLVTGIILFFALPR